MISYPGRDNRLSPLFQMQIHLQRIDILLKGSPSFGGDAASGAGTFPFKSFFDSDVTRPRQLVELHAQIAGGGLDKIGFRFHHQDRHHAKP